MCTITLGDCLKSMNLPANYYFIWLFFKLPILIILSLFLFPLIEKKIDKDLFSKIVIYSLLFTSIIIVLLSSTGLILSSLGVIGIYIGKIFIQVKNRPLYIIDKVENIES